MSWWEASKVECRGCCSSVQQVYMDSLGKIDVDVEIFWCPFCGTIANLISPSCEPISSQDFTAPALAYEENRCTRLGRPRIQNLYK